MCPNFTHLEQSKNKIKRCLQQKEFKEYGAIIEDNELKRYGTGLSLLFTFSFASKSINVHEEVLIFDETGLVGSIGGSLGLFIGFSFFGSIVTFLNVILDKWTVLKKS